MSKSPLNSRMGFVKVVHARAYLKAQYMIHCRLGQLGERYGPLRAGIDKLRYGRTNEAERPASASRSGSRAEPNAAARLTLVR